MPNPCETCPTLKKINTCCSSNPETGAKRMVRLNKTGEILYACDQLAPNGNCEIYGDRPDACREYVCEKLYAMGLNSRR